MRSPCKNRFGINIAAFRTKGFMVERSLKKWSKRVNVKKDFIATTKSTLFAVNKDEWNTKDDTGFDSA